MFSTSFPGGIDSLTNPVGTDDVSVVDHAAQHANANDAIVAIETYLLTTVGKFADNETPGGTIDGSNAAFTLAHTPKTGSLRLFLNGQFLTLGVDYTLSTVTITFSTPPDAGFSGLPFKAFYRY